jgi:hypothetical protein
MQPRHDPVLIDAIAIFISEYREDEQPPAKMLEAVLAYFPQSSSADYALALVEANRRQRADVGNG